MALVKKAQASLISPPRPSLRPPLRPPTKFFPHDHPWYEEKEALEAIFGEDFQTISDTSFMLKISSTFHAYSGFWLAGHLPFKYPHELPDLYIQTFDKLTREQSARVYEIIQETKEAHRGEAMIYTIWANLNEYMQQFTPPSIEEIDPDDLHYTGEVKEVRMLNPIEFTGDIAEIIRGLPSDIVVTNLENILRSDLVWRYKNYQAFLEKRYITGKPKHVRQTFQKFLQPQLGFHGTRDHNMPGIVQQGLLVPDRSHVRHTCGTRYGRGIYVTPDPMLATHYAWSDQLFVCMVLPGKTYKVPESEEWDMWDSKLHEGYDSHTSQDGSQVVLFHEGQVLPCFVMHFREKRLSESDRKRVDDQLRGMFTLKDCNIQRGDTVQVKKQKIEWMTLYARKLLPYGFGKGRFMVEWMAVEDDDDEWTADYQKYHNDKLDMYQNYRYG